MKANPSAAVRPLGIRESMIMTIIPHFVNKLLYSVSSVVHATMVLVA